jgi:hypothetical protein
VAATIVATSVNLAPQPFGRFDGEADVGPTGRLEFRCVYTTNVKLADDIDLEQVS